MIVPPAVSIHAPARGATGGSSRRKGGSRTFQSTPPHGERRRPETCRTEARRFNPRPRTGSDQKGCPIRAPDAVSIHAPARGATWLTVPTSRNSSCFNPRPRTGSDRGESPGAKVRGSFNPRPRTGSDAESHDSALGFGVSIHAPARGATTARPAWLPGRPCFNPRPRTGSDLAPLGYVPSPLLFQSTPPHGERRKFEAAPLPWSKFQSTPPHGERPRFRGATSHSQRVSIHAPARGATYVNAFMAFRGAFQSTPPHGERPRDADVHTRLPWFQSTPPHGERREGRAASFVDP